MSLCVNGKSYPHKFEKTALPHSTDFLVWLESQDLFPKVYWKEKGGREIAAIGSVLTLDSPPQFASENVSSARFWGGQAFFPTSFSKDTLWHAFPRTCFFLPRYELIREAGNTTLITHSLEQTFPQPPSFSNVFLREEKSDPIHVDHLPEMQDWEISIARALEDASFEKVVLARRSTYTYSSMRHPFALITALPKERTLFAFQFSQDQAFIGATPERLYEREGRRLSTEALAGTRQRGNSKEEELSLEKELRTCPKEKREFEAVKTSIQAVLAPLCSHLSCDHSDRILKTNSLQHLYTTFDAALLDQVSDAQILSALHPTAALGGWPRKASLSYLLKHEPFERGWYGAPVGCISQDTASLAVAIRSALVDGTQLHLFSGTGIVAGSKAEQEWNELESKISQWSLT